MNQQQPDTWKGFLQQLSGADLVALDRLLFAAKREGTK